MDGSAACGDATESLTGSYATDVVLSVSLLVLSGLFSGLTLGLMSLDVSGLDIVISGGDPQEAEYAKKILPLREKGNLLLCTLLLGNTLVNALIAILSASFTSGLVGALLSTGFIVVFGEIMPQSICSRHGLLIGAYTVNIVKFFVVLLFPVAYPVARILDFALGQEMVCARRPLRPVNALPKF
jgi:metal transporter CNNM